MNKNQVIHSDNCYTVLVNLLKHYASREDIYYVINLVSYKKLIYDNNLINFIDELKPFYYNSKLKYLENCKTYNNFLTIIRHLCSYNNLSYHKKVIYKKSKSEPSYYINMSSIDI